MCKKGASESEEEIFGFFCVFRNVEKTHLQEKGVHRRPSQQSLTHTFQPESSFSPGSPLPR